MRRIAVLLLSLTFAACSGSSNETTAAHPDLAIARDAGPIREDDGGTLDLGPPDLFGETLTITPAGAEVGVGQTLQLTASQPVSWALLTLGGGSIDANGLFTAPARQTTVTVQARSNADLSLVVTATLSVQPIVELVAGGAPYGGSSDGAATAARFLNPTAVVSDSAGVLYIADADNDTIRRFDPATQQVTTLAGLAGHAGATDGVGTAARFSRPCGLALDGAVTLYVADLNNATIRKIDLATATVTTLTGLAGVTGNVDGTLAAARFSGPFKLAYGAGTLWVIDYNLSLRRVDLTGGTVSTVVAHGTSASDGALGDARLVSPSDLSVVSNGVVVLDNRVLRRVDLSAATVTSIADVNFGTPGHLYNLASNGADEVFVCSDAGLRNVSLSTPTLSGVLSPSPPCGPLAYAPGTTWSVYGIYGNTVRLLSSDGSQSIVAGQPDASVVDGTGALARFSWPESLAYDGNGGVYVGEHSVLRHVDLATGQTTTVAGTPDVLDHGDGSFAQATFAALMSMVPIGHALYVADYQNGAGVLRRLDLDSQQVVTLGSYGDNTPGAIASDGAHLWVTQGALQEVQSVGLAGTITFDPLAGVPNTAGASDGAGSVALFNYPGALTYAENELFVVDNNGVRQVDVATGEVLTVAADPGLADVGVVAYWGSRLFETNLLGGIRVIDLAAGTGQPLLAGLAQMGAPSLGLLSHARATSTTGIVALPSGDLLFIDNGSDHSGPANPSRAGENVLLRIRGL
jgi:hypothetical protein